MWNGKVKAGCRRRHGTTEGNNSPGLQAGVTNDLINTGLQAFDCY